MTLFAGALSLQADCAIPEQLQAGLAKHLRAANAPALGETHHYSERNFFLAHWDSGALTEPAWVDEGTRVLALAGDPILPVGNVRPPRSEQLRRLSPSGSVLAEGELARCRGSFSMVAYDAGEHRLALATDLVGLRSVYYTVQDGVLVFSTALRVLESLPGLRRALCQQGMAEQVTFSFPLAERTPYAEISVLRECEMLTVAQGRVEVARYFDWASSPSGEDDEAALDALHLAFKEAIQLRAGKDASVYSFLSGGMDSRAIAAMLWETGLSIQALNFSPTGSQDQRFAQRLVEKMGDRCQLHCLRGGSFPNFSLLALAAKSDLEARQTITVDRRSCLWSGDGGSVGLGHVYMDEHMIAQAEKHGALAAAQAFLDFNRLSLPAGVLGEDVRQTLPSQLSQAMADEINRYENPDWGRKIYFFLLFNDQRRHLFKHFESVDLHGLELLTPFYDAKFLRAVATWSSREGILHRLYAKWFERLPAIARQTPWQTYPGHVPCPVPNEDKDASYQWAERGRAPQTTLVQRLAAARQMIADYGVVRHAIDTFSGPRVWLAAALHTLGLRECSHIAAALAIYRLHAERASPASAA